MPSKLVRALLVCAVATVFAVALNAAISIQTVSPYTQNFAGMGIPGSISTASALPADFRVDTLTGARIVGSFGGATTSVARAGGGNVGSTAANGSYSFGAGTTSGREWWYRARPNITPMHWTGSK